MRIKATGEAGTSIITKVKNKVNSSYNLRSDKKCMPLVLNFPYSRLTVSEVVALFRAYNIRLGINELRAEDIVKNMKTLDKDKFELLIHQAFDKLRASSSDYCLILDHDDMGSLRIT